MPWFHRELGFFGLLSVFSQVRPAILLSQSVIWLFFLFLASLLIKCFINSSDTEAPRTHLRSPVPAPSLITGAPAGQVAELFRLHWLLPRHPSARGISPVPCATNDDRCACSSSLHQHHPTRCQGDKSPTRHQPFAGSFG